MKQRRDILCQEINVGDYIAYGTGQGGLQVGRVDEVKRKNVEQYDYRTSQTVWVEQIKLKVSVPPTWSNTRATTLSESCSLVKIDSNAATLIQEQIDAPNRV
jgi:hypothetical protein